MDLTHPLQRYREKQEPPLTQEQLAEKIGVNRVTVWRWERGERYPDRRFWPLIREVTGIPAKELLGAVE